MQMLYISEPSTQHSQEDSLEAKCQLRFKEILCDIHHTIQTSFSECGLGGWG